jgi:alpha-beta hydrolase superfamily lysophospholipase
VVKTEIVNPAIDSGYKKIILVGISLGGYGALLYVTEASHNIGGVVVMVPFIGGFFINDAIQSAGGLSRWEECPPIEWD